MIIRTILCPVDFSPLSTTQLRSAVEICSRFGARLVLEHNVDPAPPLSLGVGWMWSESHETGVREREDAAKKRLQQLFETVPKPVRVEGVLTRGPIAAVLLQVARELPAELIVMGSHGASTAEHTSVTEQVVAQAIGPVLTSQADPLAFAEGVEIVVAIDFTPASQAALGYAFAIAEKVPVRLALLHVATSLEENAASRDRERPGSPQRALEAAVPSTLADRTAVVIGHGAPAEAILGFARSRSSGAIMLGLHRKGLVRQHLSVQARRVLHESRCPVWFVPAPRS